MSQFFFIFGFVLCIAAVTAGIVSGSWQAAPIGLLAAGATSLLVAIAWSISRGGIDRRSAQAGTNAILSTVSVFVILGMLNFLAVQHVVEIDLTEAKLFTLTPETKEILAALDRPLKIWIFDRVPNEDDRQLLENYQSNSGRILFEFVDPEMDVARVQEFGVQSYGEVHLEYGDRQQLVQSVSPAQRLNEAEISNAIAQVLRDRVLKVYFLQGHGEAPLELVEGGVAQAAFALREKGYEVETLNLAEVETIPETASAIAILSPKRQLFEGEVEALQGYLDRGGGILLAIDPDVEVGLDSWLENWGIELDDRLAIDASGRGSAIGLGPVSPLVTRYGNHPITENFNDGISVFPLARLVEFNDEETVTATPLVFTSEESWAESDLTTETLTFDPESDRNGPLTLGFALSRTQEAMEVADGEAEAEAIAEEEDTDSEDVAAIEEENTEGEEATASEEENAEGEEVTAGEEENTEGEEVTAGEEENTEGEEVTASEEENTEGEDVAAGEEEAAEATEGEETAEETESEPIELVESRFVVFGSSTFVTNGWFEQQLNSDIFLNAIDWLANQEEEPIGIRPREQTERRLNMTPLQAQLIGWSALAILPLLGLITAVATWWQRR